jgi:probable HAF family extracellular repeat protein
MHSQIGWHSTFSLLKAFAAIACALLLAPIIIRAQSQYEIVNLGQFGSVEYSPAQAVAINDRGQIVVNSSSQCFLWENGKVTALPEGTFGTGINNSGQVVGAWTPAGSTSSHVFLWHGGHLSDLGRPLGAVSARANAINEVGQIAGEYRDENDRVQAFFWWGAYTDLGSLGGGQASATAIDDLGRVVGNSQTVEGYTHGFIWQKSWLPWIKSVMTDLSAPQGIAPSVRAVATGINNRGEIIGAWGDRAYILRNGIFTRLNGYLPSGDTPTAINARGLVVGNCLHGPGTRRWACAWDDGVLITLGVPPSGTQSFAQGVNNRGQVVGAGQDVPPRTLPALLWNPK